MDIIDIHAKTQQTGVRQNVIMKNVRLKALVQVMYLHLQVQEEWV